MKITDTAKIKEELTDATILKLVSNKESIDRGFKMLMDTYQERLYWHIRRLVSVHEDTDDVLQNTFIKVYKSITRFEGKSKLYTWLYRIATNESITFLNKRKRHHSEQIDNPEGDISMRLKADPYWDGDSTELILQKALSTLPERQRAVFNMRYYDEMPYKQMSEVLETSEGGLKASYHHATKKIEAYIKLHSENL